MVAAYYPIRSNTSYMASPEELARAIWDEKERRDESAKEVSRLRRRKAEEERYYKKISQELGEALIRGEII